MWVNKALFEAIIEENKHQRSLINVEREFRAKAESQTDSLRVQNTKDTVMIDWLRNRVNALEKERAILLNKTSGVHVPIPEIVPTRPGSIGGTPDYDHIPSYEDVGDNEAQRLGIMHDDDGRLIYR